MKVSSHPAPCEESMAKFDNKYWDPLLYRNKSVFTHYTYHIHIIWGYKYLFYYISVLLNKYLTGEYLLFQYLGSTYGLQWNEFSTGLFRHPFQWMIKISIRSYAVTGSIVSIAFKWLLRFTLCNGALIYIYFLQESIFLVSIDPKLFFFRL